MTLALHAAVGTFALASPTVPLRAASIAPGLVAIGLLTVVLTVLGIVAYPRVAARLGWDVEDADDSVERFESMDDAVVGDDGSVTLPGGVRLEGPERAAVAAVHDYFERRPGATREEVIRVLYRRHPAGYDDPEEWWSSLVSPALDALASAPDDAPTADPFERSFREANP